MATRLWTSLVLALADGSPFEELDEEWSERSYDDLLRLRTVSYSDGNNHFLFKLRNVILNFHLIT